MKETDAMMVREFARCGLVLQVVWLVCQILNSLIGGIHDDPLSAVGA